MKKISSRTTLQDRGKWQQEIFFRRYIAGEKSGFVHQHGTVKKKDEKFY